MLQIIVEGVKSKKIHDRIKSCTKFYLKKLLKKKILDNIQLKIKVLRERNVEDAYGICIPHGKDPETGKESYEIHCVHSPKRNPEHGNVYKNIAHEVVHLKQYATGQLGKFLVTQRRARGNHLTGTLWEGKIYDVQLDESDETYYTSPWEIEAYGREVGLYRLWKNSIGETEY